MALKGDIGALSHVRDELARKREALPEIAKEAAERIDKAEVGTIASGFTPYLEPWEPLVNGGQLSPDIIEHIAIVPGAKAIRARLDRVATYHQRGTRKMVARPLVPIQARGVPKSWKDEIDAATAYVLGGK